jgi:uncharacterized phage protein (TIGR01671 family)
MREIKFRAWDTQDEKWIEFNDLKFGAHGVWAVVYYDQKQGDIVQEMAYIELMQYTGLKDKNGTEIYEGDFFKPWDDDRLYKISWNTDYAKFRCEQVAGRDWPCDLDQHIYGEVTGNIYENPELLTKT